MSLQPTEDGPTGHETQNGVASETAPCSGASVKPKRRPGRPKGLGRVPGSGRKKGVPNRLLSDVRQEILNKGRPDEVLFKVCRGNKIKVADPKDPTKYVWMYPTVSDRLSAATRLLGKIIPDLKAQELPGADGAPLIPAEEFDQAEIVRRLTFILSSAENDAGPPPPKRLTHSPEAPAPPIVDKPKAEVPVEPKRARRPQPGQECTVGSHTIRCVGQGRPGLPPRHVIVDEGGAIITWRGGFDDALQWCELKFGPAAPGEPQRSQGCGPDKLEGM